MKGRGRKRQPARRKPLVSILPAAPQRSYRGRRARRQAFYHRSRCVRILQRVANQLGEAYNERMSAAWRDMLVYGTGWFMVGPDALTERKIAPTPDPEVFSVIDTYRTDPGSRYTSPT